jgi:hypothetical protein
MDGLSLCGIGALEHRNRGLRGEREKCWHRHQSD